MREATEIILMLVAVGILLIIASHTGIMQMASGDEAKAKADAEGAVATAMRDAGATYSESTIKDLDNEYDFAGTMRKISQALA